MKESINDLNAYLFDALNSITNDDLSPEDLDRELKRAETITRVAETIIHTGELTLKAIGIANEYNVPMPKLLGGEGK